MLFTTTFLIVIDILSRVGGPPTGRNDGMPFAWNYYVENFWDNWSLEPGSINRDQSAPIDNFAGTPKLFLMNHAVTVSGPGAGIPIVALNVPVRYDEVEKREEKRGKIHLFYLLRFTLFFF
jgi:hypothetical protein